MANTVEELYTQVLGRAPDAEGLAYWKNAFGGSVDSNEQASFMQAVQSALANKTPAEQTALAPNLFNGVTTGNTVAPTVVNALGGPVQKLPPAPTDTTPAASSEDTIAKLTKQILASSDNSKWTGEGLGSPEANAKNMAGIMAGIGITDISQFGQVTKTIPAHTAEDETGTYTVPAQTITTFGNKATGQEVPNTYSERQTGNFFGGTFAGKGNTGYGVQFDANGKPIFYTQGASSSDIGNILPLLQIGLMATGAGGLLGNAILGAGASQVAAGALGGGLISGATSALTGGDFLKGAALGAAGGAIAGYFSPATGDITSTPTEGSVPVSSDVMVPGYYDEITGKFISDVNGGLQGPLTNLTSGTTVMPSGTNGYYNELTGEYVYDVNGGMQGPLTNATSGTNLSSMDGYSYDPKTGDWTLPTGEVISTSVNQNPITNGATILSNAGATGTAVSGLTATQIANLAKAGISVAGLLGGTAAVTGGGGGGGTGGVGALPTQGVPLNSQDYFNAIQQNYNALLPAVPRDVSTPLAQWYNSAYGGGTTPVTNVTPVTPQTASGGMFSTPAVVNPIINPPALVSPQASTGLPPAPAVQTGTGTPIMPAAPTTAGMSHEQSVQTIQEMPTATSTAASNVTFTPGQKAYADYLKTQPGQGSPSDIDNYVKGLSDYQALASLDVMSGNRLNIPATMSGYDTAALLANKYKTTGPVSFGSGVSVDYGTGLISGRSATDSSITGGSIGAGNTDTGLLSGLDQNTIKYLQSLPTPRNA